jgi:hypothetical protein
MACHCELLFCHCERSEAILMIDVKKLKNQSLKIGIKFAFKFPSINPTDCFTAFAMTAIYIIFDITPANFSKSPFKCKALTTKRVTGKSVAVGYGKQAVIIPFSFKNSCTPD